MNSRRSSPIDASEEIFALIETLLATERRLDELAGGEVDTVAGRDGRAFLLRRAQEQLRYNWAARQHAVLNALPAHIALLNTQGIIISVNEAWRRFAIANTFHGPGHGVGRNYLDVCEQSEAHQVAAGIRAVLGGTEKSFSIEYPCHSHAEKRWFLLTVTPLAKNRQSGAVVMHLNITERRQAEAAAIRMAGIVESSGDAIIGKTLEGIITSWNKGAELLFGYAAAEMVGNSMTRLLPPGRQDAHEHILARIKRGDNVEHFETVRQTKAGTLVDISVTASPIRDATGEVIGMSIVARDITNRMRAESALRASQANMAAAQRLAHFGSWELELTNSKNADANALQWSDEMFRIAGYEPGAVEVSSDLFFRLVHPDDREPIRQSVASAIRERQVYSIVHRLIRADGETRVVQETGQIFFDETTGEAAKIVGTAHDITERKRAEAELERAHRELVEASRQAGMAEVATGILHNVGNVLNSVNIASSCVADRIRKSRSANLGKVVGLLREHEADLGGFLTADAKGKRIPGYLAQLAEHLADEQTAALKELAHLQKNIEHIKDIIAMQQDFAKVSDTAELLSVADLVEDALRMNASALARHDVVVSREFQEVPLLMVEKHQVLQILVNLVRNAMQACDEVNPLAKQITLRITRGSDGVRIAVTDNGIGISAENLTRLFAHGFTTKQSGHGFGLHSAALAAKKMGGALTVQSDGPGQGATFTLELPYSTRENAHE